MPDYTREIWEGGTPLDELRYLGDGPKAWLKHQGVVAIEQIPTLEDRDLLRMANIGRATVKTIRLAYAAHQGDQSAIKTLQDRIIKRRTDIVNNFTRALRHEFGYECRCLRGEICDLRLRIEFLEKQLLNGQRHLTR